MVEQNRSIPSLAQYFEAPDDYLGSFGWLCGYSADALFLNDAIERFTRESQAQRAARGSLSLALMLDPGQPAIGPVEVPGLVHLPLLSLNSRKFRLLHAKVALLGFRHVCGDGRWRIRLLVSTGNWTRQTVEDSLDLAWSIDLNMEDVAAPNEEVALRCADVKAATLMFRYLQGQFDLRLLDAGVAPHYGPTQEAREALDRWLNMCIKRAGGKVRFRDNRQRSFLAQLPDAIKDCGAEGGRNYLAMASGFFESQLGERQGAVPSVLSSIVSRLSEEKLLTRSARINLFVNPLACQGVAGALDALNAQGWKVWPADQMEAVFGKHGGRALHAKFLFSAGRRSGSDACLSAWVYLGSGNLTHPGFASRMSTQGGNLEAGVIFAPKGLEWGEGANVASTMAVERFLPIRQAAEITHGAGLCAGERLPPTEDCFIAPPLAWLQWSPTRDGGHLLAQGDELMQCEVLSAAGEACAVDAQGVVWLGPRPRQVSLRWLAQGNRHECQVPVMDEFGRLAAAPLTALDFSEAWWGLAEFPAVYDGMDAEAEDIEAGTESQGKEGKGATVAAYPVRQMMELLENIADRQTSLLPADWKAWCARLEQTLSRTRDSQVLEYFRELGLNPVSPLRVSSFRPAFAEHSSSPEGALYEQMLARLEDHWQTANLKDISGDAA
jgi:hypothetical protein